MLPLITLLPKELDFLAESLVALVFLNSDELNSLSKVGKGGGGEAITLVRF